MGLRRRGTRHITDMRWILSSGVEPREMNRTARLGLRVVSETIDE
jgi:hypothetical protein